MDEQIQELASNADSLGPDEKENVGPIEPVLAGEFEPVEGVQQI